MCGVNKKNTRVDTTQISSLSHYLQGLGYIPCLILGPVSHIHGFSPFDFPWLQNTPAFEALDLTVEAWIVKLDHFPRVKWVNILESTT